MQLTDHACKRATVQWAETKAGSKAPTSAPAAERYEGREKMNMHDLTIRDTPRSELDWVFATEASAPNGTVLPYTRENHETEYFRENIKYKTIISNNLPVGFIILSLDTDTSSVEFRRIVISKPGCGFGKKAIMLLDEVCQSEFGRNRIWLDVFAGNTRARHVYEACGYIRFGETELDGRTLYLYQKEINEK